MEENKVYQANLYDALVFIGRFQIWHEGHTAVVHKAFEKLRKNGKLVLCVGSAFTARNIKNPFTYDERVNMIKQRFNNDSRLIFVPIFDFPYDDTKWVTAVQQAVDSAVPDAKKVGLIGHSKDSSSYYLNIFPKWKNHVEVKNHKNINATDIRKTLFENPSNLNVLVQKNILDESIKVALEQFSSTSTFAELLYEYEMIKNYKASWQDAPFPPTFVTTDAVVEQSGHVLLVTRKKAPGKGAWALPGGFLNQEETIEEGMIRELHEETQIKLQPQVLRGSIKQVKVFDKPDRDFRGRTITHAFHIKLKDMSTLPHIKGADDAEKAEWVSVADIIKNRDKFYADHFYIISHFLNIG